MKSIKPIRGRKSLPEDKKRKPRTYYLTDQERAKMDAYHKKIKGE